MAEDDKRSKEKLEETRRVKGEVGGDKADGFGENLNPDDDSKM